MHFYWCVFQQKVSPYEECFFISLETVPTCEWWSTLFVSGLAHSDPDLNRPSQCEMGLQPEAEDIFHCANVKIVDGTTAANFRSMRQTQRADLLWEQRQKPSACWHQEVLQSCGCSRRSFYGNTEQVLEKPELHLTIQHFLELTLWEHPHWSHLCLVWPPDMKK